MHALKGTVLLVTVTVGACGARTQLGASVSDRSLVTPHGACESADGVRICGGTRPCPDIPAPQCPGYGCEYGYQVDTSARSNGGICFADLADLGDDPCFVCHDGEACMARGPDELVCVPPEVCAALWDEGIRDVCRYADKGKYDHRPIPAAPGDCPSGAAGILCGGGCGACARADSRCTGRSPEHPFGICAIDWAKQDPSKATSYFDCVLSAGANVIQWCDGLAAKPACAVFAQADPSARAAARRNGVCIGQAACVAIAKAGGVECYDRHGNRLAP